MTRIMLIDDQQLFIDGMKALLLKEKDMEVIAKATTGRTGLQQFMEHLPEVVLIDIHMPHTDAIKLILHMKEVKPNVKVLVLTSFTDEDLIISAIYAGADGFLLKNLNGDRLKDSIRKVMNDEVIFSGEVAQILAKRVLERRLDKRELLDEAFQQKGIHLSNRELDVAYLMAKGISNKHIAERLFLSEGTVKNYISNIYQTFQINNRKELIAYFRQLLDKKVLT